MSTDKLKYDSTGAGEYVRGNTGIKFAAPGGATKDPSVSTGSGADSEFAERTAGGGATKVPGARSGSPSGFARPGGAQSI